MSSPVAVLIARLMCRASLVMLGHDTYAALSSDQGDGFDRGDAFTIDDVQLAPGDARLCKPDQGGS